jgi:hypothetical protein
LHLRAFADANEQIQVTDLETSKAYRTSIANAALETRYYDFEVQGVRVSVEDWLARIEGQAARVLDSLIDDPATITSISYYDRLALARFVTALWLRVPHMRARHRSLRSDMVAFAREMTKNLVYNRYRPEEADALWAEWKDQPDEWFLQEQDPYQEGLLTARTLGNLQRLANLLLAMPWRVGHTPLPSACIRQTILCPDT